VNHKWTQYNPILNLNEIIVKHKTFGNLDAPDNIISRTKWCAYFVKPSINKWIISENHYNITTNLNETIVKIETFVNLDAPNDWISRTKRCAYFVKPSINERIIIETNITSYQSSVKLLCETWNLWETSTRQTAQFLVPNDVPTLWNCLYTSESLVKPIKHPTKPQWK
jgi:hypothetical protein